MDQRVDKWVKIMKQSAAMQYESPAQEDVTADTSAVPVLTVERGSLLKALGHLQSVVEKRNTIPILSNVKLTGYTGTLELMATDMEIGLTERIPADVQKDGAITVPVHMLYDIVRKLPDGTQVHFRKSETEEGRLAIHAGHSHFLLPFLSASEFPVIHPGDMDHHFTLTASELTALGNKTRFAVSTDETRYYLNGIFLHSLEQTLIAVSTDGHRLAKMAVTLPAGAEHISGMIIPRKTVGELLKLIEGLETPVEISVSKTKIAFVCGEAVLISKLVEGTYPEYQNVIPDSSNHIMEVEVAQLIGAVDRIATVSSEKTRAIRLMLADNRLELAAANEKSGSGEEVIEVSYTGAPMDCGFNARYILDVLATIESKTVQFMFSDKGDATIILDPASHGALYVIMPMRI